MVVLDADHGQDVGVVSLSGELVRAQMNAKGTKNDHEIKRIERKATQEDIDTWQKASMREQIPSVKDATSSKASGST